MKGIGIIEMFNYSLGLDMILSKFVKVEEVRRRFEGRRGGS